MEEINNGTRKKKMVLKFQKINFQNKAMLLRIESNTVSGYMKKKLFYFAVIIMIV